jgi:hypothetical protein
VKLQWLKLAYSKHVDSVEFSSQPHEHVLQGTVVSLLKDESDKQHFGVFLVRNSENVHFTVHVTATNQSNVKVV